MCGLTALAVIGLGLSAAGTATSIMGASEAADANAAIAQQEEKANEVNKQAMELDAHRKMLDVLRNQQRARAVAEVNATAQGAGGPGSSGLPGGYGQIGGMTGENLAGISANLGFGEQKFAIDSIINQQKIQLAGAQGTQATGAGLTSLGGAFMNAVQPVSRLSGANIFAPTYSKGA